MVKQHRLSGLLDGSVNAPSRMIVDDKGKSILNPAFEEFEIQDSSLASWLLSSVSSSVLPELVGYDTAAQIWSRLEQIFSAKSDSKILSYRNQLTNQHKGELTMRDYLANIKS